MILIAVAMATAALAASQSTAQASDHAGLAEHRAQPAQSPHAGHGAPAARAQDAHASHATAECCRANAYSGRGPNQN